MNPTSLKPKSQSVSRISLILPKPLASKLRAAAKREKRSLNAQVALLLEAATTDGKRAMAA